MKRFDEYQLILFDMDGTLYFQRALQLKMAFLLLKNVLLQKRGWQELAIVLKFRRLRESAVEGDGLDEKLYNLLAEKWNMDAGQISEIIQKWIYQKPLEYLGKYRDKQLIEMMKKSEEMGVKVAVYSDYPTKEKQNVLGIDDVMGFYAGQKEIRRLKPDAKGIEVIMECFRVTDKRKVLMIGDRKSKDGQAAKNADIDFLILKKYKFMRRCQYMGLLH